LGYCPQTDSIDPYLTVREQLHVYSLMAGYSRAQCVSIAVEAMDSLGLNQYAEVLCADLSGGNKRKVCVAVSLLGRPPIVLMDEPSSGLDPGSKRQVWTSVTSAVSRGQSVMLTSHNMAEVDSLCDRLTSWSVGRFEY